MSETHESSGHFWKEMIKSWRIKRFAAALVGGIWHAEYLASLGFDRRRIFIGYDVVDNDHFASNTLRDGAVQLPANRFFFANSRFLKWKNINGLLLAYKEYREICERRMIEPWLLVISGSGIEEDSLKLLSNQLQLSDYVVWPGFLPYHELPNWYQAADCFVHVAHKEAWGLVINEACAAGLPVIAGNRVGATCELVRNGENGWLVSSSAIQEISNAMISAACLPEEQRLQFGLRSRSLVSQFAPLQFGEGLVRAMDCSLE